MKQPCVCSKCLFPGGYWKGGGGGGGCAFEHCLLPEGAGEQIEEEQPHTDIRDHLLPGRRGELWPVAIIQPIRHSPPTFATPSLELFISYGT